MPKTIENMREPDVTYVDADDEEIRCEEASDELASYFTHRTSPKVLLTTSPKAKLVRSVD